MMFNLSLMNFINGNFYFDSKAKIENNLIKSNFIPPRQVRCVKMGGFLLNIIQPLSMKFLLFFCFATLFVKIN